MEKEKRIFWLVVFGLLLLTRVPAASQFLSIDNVNLALALENFDPRIHQPQPPGYPFFVGAARLFNFFIRDAERTFLLMSVLTSALCLPLVYALGARMFSEWAGRAATLLLLVNPVFWHSGLDGPLRPNLALFALLVGWCGWRCWNGERQFALWGAAALAVGSGFRPDLAAYMLPLWLISTWVGTRSLGALFRGLVVMGAIALVWTGALSWAVGGTAALLSLTRAYLVNQSVGESLALGGPGSGWMHQLSRLAIWNGIAVVGWIWAAAVAFRVRGRLSLQSPQSVFMLAWLLPGLLLQALVHVAAPGHTLFSVVALCIIGGYVLSVAFREAQSREVALSAAVIVNLMLFLNYFPLPSPAEPGEARSIWRSAMDAGAFATFETSLNSVRFVDDVALTTLKELKELTPNDRPAIIVTTNVHRLDWFLNWRIARYYAPKYDIWVVADQEKPQRIEHIRRNRVLESMTGDSLRVPVPRRGRVLWLLELGGPFHKELAGAQKVSSGRRILYTDIAEDASPFRVLGYEFVPVDATSAGGPPSGVQ